MQTEPEGATMTTMSRRSFALFATLCFLLLALLMVPAAWAQRERPLTTAGHLKAYPREAPCGPVVHVDVNAPDERYFVETDRDNQRTLQRLLKRVHRNLQNQCPGLMHIVFIGKVDGREVYHGLASAEGNWEIAKIAAAAIPQVHFPVQNGNSGMPVSAADSAATSPSDEARTPGDLNMVTVKDREGYNLRKDATSVRANSARGAERESRRHGTASIPDSPCRTAAPDNIDDVFKCMTAGRLPDRAYDCSNMASQWLSRLTELGGFTREDARKRLPDCKVFAQVAKDIYGEPPYWATCIDYGEKDARAHLDECLSAYLPKYTGSSNSLKRIVGCDQVRSEYEKALKAANPEHRLPDGYVPPDCDDANTLVAKWTGKDPRAHPCAGFDPDDISGHISKCFGSSSAAVSLRNVKNCTDARRAYEQKLREAYGDLPAEYVMARCTELEPLQAMAEKYRAEAAAKAEDMARKRNELERRRMAEANEQINRQGHEAIKRYKSVAGAATGMVENPIKPLPEGECDISFEGYNQQGVLQAFYSGKFDALKENRSGVLFYIAAFHNSIAEAAANTMDKHCMRILDQRLTKAAADELLTQMGLGRGGSLDSFASGGLGALLGVLNDVATNPAGIQQNEMNKTVLQNQGKADAVLVVTNIGCQSDVAKRLYKNAQHFVYNTQPIKGK